MSNLLRATVARAHARSTVSARSNVSAGYGKRDGGVYRARPEATPLFFPFSPSPPLKQNEQRAMSGDHGHRPRQLRPLRENGRSSRGARTRATPSILYDRKVESCRKDDAKVYKDIVHVPLRRLPKGRAQFVPHKVLCAHSRFL